MKSKITLLSILAVLFFIPNVSAQCTSGSMYPATTFTPACTGAAETVNTDCWAGEYASVNVIANKQYTFASSLATDYITLTDATGATIYASGTTPVTWASGATSGTIRYFIHKSAACVTENIGRIRYITCTSVASCASPTGLFVSDITSNSAKLNWTPPASLPSGGYEYFRNSTGAAPSASSNPTGTLSNTSVSTTIPANVGTTTYYWMRSNCTSTKGDWVYGGSFNAIPFQSCNSASYGLYPEATYIPLNTGNPEQIGNNAWAGEYSNVAVSANKQYTFTSSVGTDYITITNSTGTVVYASGTTPLSWNSGASTGVFRYYLHTNSSCGEQAAARSRYITSADTASSCPTPNTLVRNGVSSTTVSLYWGATDVPSNGFDYLVTASGTTPTGASVPTGSTANTYATQIPGLVPNTFYYAWVRSNCGATKSAWYGPLNFTTLPTTSGNGCTAGSLYPAATFSPSCSGNPELITSVAYAGEYSNISVANGRKLTFSSSIATDFITVTNTAGTQILAYGLTPVVYIVDSGTTTLRFYIHSGTDCGVENANRDRYVTCQTSVCPSPGSPIASGVTASGATLSWTPTTSPGLGYEYYLSTSNVLSPQYNTTATGTSAATSKVLSDLNAATTYYFWIRSACTADSKSNWVYGGSFTTQTATSCNPPMNLVTSFVTSNSAYLNFAEPNPLPSEPYQYYITTNNFAPTDASNPSGTFTTGQTTVAGLIPEQTYNYWLRSNCSGSVYSSWVPGGSFTTLAALSCNGTDWGYGIYPATTFTPTCNGSAETITNSTWAGEFCNVDITAGSHYTFSSSVATDYITITNTAGDVAYASGTTPVTWNSGNISGTIRYFIHTDSSCGVEKSSRTRSISCISSNVSIVGDGASGWDNDILLSTTDGINFTLNNYTLTTGGVKFRLNGAWITNWGNNTFPTGTGFQDGPNIPAVACTYDISFNTLTGAYSFVSTSSQPVKPTGTATQSFCNGATVADFAVTGTNIKWYDSATGGNLLVTNTPLVNGTTYYASQSNGSCESLLRLAITANLSTTAPPTAAATQTFCVGAVVGNLVSTGTSRKFYNVPVDGSSLPPAALLATGTYYVTQTLNSCESARTPINVIVNSNTPVFTAVAPICSGTALAALPTTSNNGITGTWSPALNNTATTTYTFAPTTGQCATTTTMTITVNQKVTPTFTPIAAICSGAALAALPVDSTNGINGSWSPALNNTATTTYTFTPSAGQCANTTTMTITVNQPTTPAFAAISPICSGAALAALPVDSTNGINGSWSPALNNTATTTYTFTPSAGQCATTTTMTITVNQPTAPAFAAVSPICSGAALAALPTTSNNGITGSWSPALNNTATTTYTFTPTTGQCATTKTMVITVNQKVAPAFAAVAPICSGAALAALPTTSNNGITGTWSPALNNTATTTYTFTPTVGQCANSATMTITVTPNVTPTFTAVAPICAGSVLNPLPVTSNNGITGSWSPALNNTATTTYTFTPSAGQCATTATLTITVNPVVTPAFTAVAPICSGAALAALPTTSNNGINGTWSPALNNTATTTYTFTPAAGQCAATAAMTITVNPVVTPTFIAVAPICSGAALAALPTASNNSINGTWSPALNNIATTTYTFTPTAGQCATTATLTITVNPVVTPTFTAVAPICSGAALAALPTTSNNGINGTWSPALNNTATTTYTFTPTAGQCATTAAMTITVNPVVTPTFTAVAPICSGAALAALPTTSNNGITGTWSPALNNTATTTYTFTPAAGQCATTATLTITVNPVVTPTFTAVAPICSGAALAALPTISNNGITGTWSPVLNNTATTTYTFTPTAGQCATTAAMTITVNPVVTPTFTAVAPICSGAALAALPTNSNNGITGIWSPALNNTATTTYTFTPTAGQCATTAAITITVNPVITPTFAAVAPICSGAALAALPTTSNNGINGTWSPALNNTATTTYTFTPTAGQCATTAALTITVNPVVTPTFAAVAPICSGTTLAALPTTSSNGINGTWSPALSNTATTTYTFTPTAGQCAITAALTITVNPVVTPTFAAVAPICSGTTLAALSTTSNNGINGTWSPALSNTATTTYTFTPTAGQCATTTTVTITVNPVVTPAFTAVAPICSGAALAVLPTTSNNGINGTWSPALDNTATTTYTFTPTAGQCANGTTMTITVAPNVTPIFTLVAPICSGAALAALPTTSNNGINGTWSPALNNTATTTYTFTPTAGQCATTASMTITVNPVVTPTFTAVAAICAGTTLEALPTTSNNGITGNWSPALDNTATTAYMFTPDAGQCALGSTMTITVNPNILPTFTQVAPICSGAALAALPTISDNGISGSWSPALDNTATTTYTFTHDAGQCATTATMTITVNAAPVLEEKTAITACLNYTLPALTDGNYYTQPGGAGAMLNAGDVITTSQTLYVYADNGMCTSEISFDVTISAVAVIDALEDVVACGSYTLPALTTNASYYTEAGGNGTMLSAGDVITTSQTIYIYVLGAAAVCTAESDFTVTITPMPTVAVLADVAACDSYTLPALENGNYYTEAAGAGTMLNAGDTLTGTQTIYVYATNGNCTAESDFTVTITSTPIVATLADVAACDSYTLPALANGNYYTEADGAGIVLNAGDTLTETQTVYVYAANGDCTAQSDFTVTITPTPIVATLADVAACDSYTLTALANGNYYTEAAGAGTMLNAGDVLIETQTVYVYAGNGDCTAQSSFTVTINTTDNGTTLDSETITANQDNATYQWVSCGGSPVLIDGATGQSFTATANGQYAVMITLGDCSVTSECVTIDTLGTDDFSMNLITMYPNPSRGTFTVDTGNIVADSIYIIDNLGRLVLQYAPTSQQSLMDANRYEDGVYYIKIRYQNKETTKKLILRKN